MSVKVVYRLPTTKASPWEEFFLEAGCEVADPDLGTTARKREVHRAETIVYGSLNWVNPARFKKN
jgi:hypothetical protein